MGRRKKRRRKYNYSFPPVKSTAVAVCLIKPSPCKKTSSINYYNKEKATQPFRN